MIWWNKTRNLQRMKKLKFSEHEFSPKVYWPIDCACDCFDYSQAQINFKLSRSFRSQWLNLTANSLLLLHETWNFKPYWSRHAAIQLGVNKWYRSEKYFWRVFRDFVHTYHAQCSWTIQEHIKISDVFPLTISTLTPHFFLLIADCHLYLPQVRDLLTKWLRVNKQHKNSIDSSLVRFSKHNLWFTFLLEIIIKYIERNVQLSVDIYIRIYMQIFLLYFLKCLFYLLYMHFTIPHTHSAWLIECDALFRWCFKKNWTIWTWKVAMRGHHQ